MSLRLISLLLAFLLAACSSPAERRQKVFQQSTAALDSGDPERALTILRATLAHDPRDAVLRARLATIELDLGHAGNARQTLEALPSDVIAQPEYTQLLARAFVANQQPWQALPLMLAMERQGKANPQLVDKLLRQLAHSGEVEVALPTAWRMRLLRRELAAGKPAQALDSWRRLQAGTLGRGELFDLILQRALRRNLDTLLLDLPELDESPVTPWKLLARHRLVTRQGTVGAVAGLEEEFLERFPEHPERYPMLLGVAQRKVRGGQVEEGLELARRAAKIAPERPEPLVEQGLAFTLLERPDEARQAFELALALAPHNTVARQFLNTTRSAGSPLSIRFEATGMGDL